MPNASARWSDRSAADAELFDQSAVAAFVRLLEVVEKRTSLGHELQEATTGVIVLRVSLEVAGEIVDALGQDGDLDLRGARIAGFLSVFVDKRGLALGRDRHRRSFRLGYRVGRGSRVGHSSQAAGPGCRPA